MMCTLHILHLRIFNEHLIIYIRKYWDGHENSCPSNSSQNVRTLVDAEPQKTQRASILCPAGWKKGTHEPCSAKQERRALEHTRRVSSRSRSSFTVWSEDWWRRDDGWYMWHHHGGCIEDKLKLDGSMRWAVLDTAILALPFFFY
jgi:hypothetical protein